MAPLDTDTRTGPPAGDPAGDPLHAVATHLTRNVPPSPRRTGPDPRGGGRPDAGRTHVGGWTPLAGKALLDRLRVTGRPRPLADPERADRLRRCLEEGIGRVAPGTGSPLVVTRGRLTRALSCEAHREPGGSGERPFSLPLAVGILMDVLFRQLVTTGTLGDPMVDGLDGLGVDERHTGLMDWIGHLSHGDRQALAGEVRRQATGLAERWPALDPAWLPRTEEPMRVALVGGAVELSGRVDLAIGRPGLDVASVAMVEVRSGARRAEHRDDLAFCALLETLRHPAPPFVVGTYYTRSGELDVEPVSDELLTAAARRTAAGVRAMLRDGDPGGSDGRPIVGGGTCPGCATLGATGA